MHIHTHTHRATPAGYSITLSMTYSEHTWRRFICANTIFILTVAMKTFSHLVNYESSLHLRDVPLVHMWSLKASRHEARERERDTSCIVCRGTSILIKNTLFSCAFYMHNFMPSYQRKYFSQTLVSKCSSRKIVVSSNGLVIQQTNDSAIKGKCMWARAMC